MTMHLIDGVYVLRTGLRLVDYHRDIYAHVLVDRIGIFVKF